FAFTIDFDSEINRYNFDEKAYSETCQKAYAGFKITPWEMRSIHEDLERMTRLMRKKQRDLLETWERDATHTYM
ncbi:hypothetical protein PMAYCL1PPCAC_00865, partial [Pristionchus mayeri]